MDILSLTKEAIRVINHPVSKYLVLTMPGRWGTSSIHNLSGPNSPQGEIVNAEGGNITVYFEAIDVLAWCIAKSGGAIKLKPLDRADMARSQEPT